MYPEMEFLPRAPDPEEIVIEGEEEVAEEAVAAEEEGSSDTVVEELVRNIQKQGIEETIEHESA